MAFVPIEQSAVTVSVTPIGATLGTTTISTNTTRAMVQLWADLSAMAAGDRFEIKVLEKIVAGGSQLSKSLGVIDGAVDGPWVSPAFLLINGWDFSFVRLAGVDRALSWSIREAT